MQVVCICSYVKSVLRYNFVMSDIFDPDTLHLRQQGCKWSVVIFRSQKGPVSKKVWEALLYTHLYFHVVFTRRTKGAQAGQLPKKVCCFGNRGALDSKNVLTRSITHAYLKTVT
jgi:hypothetical protein